MKKPILLLLCVTLFFFVFFAVSMSSANADNDESSEDSDTTSENSNESSDEETSEPYEYGESDTPFIYYDSCLIGIARDTKVSAVEEILGPAGKGITDKNNNAVTANTVVKTGMNAAVGKNIYRIVIAGDANGDGKVTGIDYLQFKKHIISGNELTDVFSVYAGDIDRSRKITSSDLVKIKKFLLNGLYDLDNNKDIPCTHKYGTPTCSGPAKCLVCYKQNGPVIAHKPGKATCTDPSICSGCKRVMSPALGHKNSAATCTVAATCSVCKTKTGTALGHDYAPATLLSAKYCKRCNIKVGVPLTMIENAIKNSLKINGATTFSVSDNKFVPSKENADRINHIINIAKNDLSFFAVDLTTGFSVGYNADRSMNTGCVVKAGYVLYAYKEMEWLGISLSDTMTYLPRHHYDKSGTIKLLPFGTKLTFDDILYRTIHISDNAGYYMLVDRFGRAGYNSMLEDLGIYNLGYLNEHLHLSRSSNWSACSARDLVQIWNEIYKYYQTGTPYALRYFDHLLKAEHNYLKVQLPGYKIAHKSGWTEVSFNDAGIVLQHDGHPYLVAIMSSDPSGNYLTSLARRIDIIMQESIEFYK